MKNYFLDTEFEEECGPGIMPISLALIGEQPGHQLYIEFEHDEDRAQRNAFVRQNVLPHLRGQEQYTSTQAARAICSFLQIGDHYPTENKPEPMRIWAYFASTDWVVFYNVFGAMMGLPKGCPRYPMCLKQLHSTLGSPPLKPRANKVKHDALADAEWNREFYKNMAKHIDNELHSCGLVIDIHKFGEED